MLNLQAFKLGTVVPENKAKLICFSGAEAESHCREFTGVSVQQLTSFLDIQPKPEEVRSSWPDNWRRIGVFTKENHEQIPFYLREYWTNYVKGWLEQIIEDSTYLVSYSNLGTDCAGKWRIVDVSAGSLVDDKIPEIAEFSYYVTNTIEVLKPHSEIHIAEAARLGSVLNWTKQYYLRHHFSGQALNKTTLKIRPIKREKVFFVEVDRETQDSKYYIVKFDYPAMISRERENYERVWRKLDANRRELLERIYRVEPTVSLEFGGNDILALIVSEAVRSDIAPEDLTLYRQWEEVITNPTEAREFFELVSPIFDVLAHYHRVKHVRCQCKQLFRKFFRKLNGFTLFKDFDKIDEFLPIIFEENESRKKQYRIRRIRVDPVASSADPQLTIQLEPKGRERVLIRFQEFSQTEEWPRLLSELDLLNLSHLDIDPSLLDGDQQIWSNAKAALRELIDISDLENQRELTIFKHRILNPIKFFQEVYSGKITSFELPEFEIIQSRIHFDLHLENILMPGEGVEGKLIDFASMEEGPIDYDYARMEVRIVLERAASIEFASQPISKQFASIIKLAKALTGKNAKACPRLFTKEFAFLMRLREKRAQIINTLRPSARTVLIPKEEKSLDVCLVFEYLSELFERSAAKSPFPPQLLTAFVGAACHLKNLSAKRKR